MGTLESLGLRAAVLLAIVLAWEMLARSSLSLLIPTVESTAAALVELVASPTLWRAVWASNQSMLIGFFVAAAIGIPLGLAVGRWRWVAGLADVYLALLIVLPMSALIPIVIMALGVGLVARVALIILFVLPVVAINTSAGLRSVDLDLVEMARAYGSSEWQLWRSVYLPGSVPEIMSGLRLGLGRALTGMVVFELLMVSVGIGRLLLRYQGDFDSAHVYAVVVVVMIEAILLMRLTQPVPSIAIPWLADLHSDD